MAGFAGSHLAEYLLEQTDWTIAGTVRTLDPARNLDSIRNNPRQASRVTILEVDVTDENSVSYLIKAWPPDYVFHLAATGWPAVSFDNPRRAMETNIIGTANVLQACSRHAPNAWVQVCSSADVYGKSTSREPLTESSPIHPASPYSISKIGADLLGRHYAERGSNVIVTRSFTHTGPRRSAVFVESSFARQIAMIEAGLENPPIQVGNLESVRTIADVRDIARAYHMALTVEPERGAVYNIGGIHTCAVRELLDLLFQSAGRTYPIAVDRSRLRPIDADYQVPDCTPFVARTGWQPRYALEDTIRDLLNYWRARVATEDA